MTTAPAFPTADLRKGDWLNPPVQHRVEADALCLDAEPGSDFWVGTHFGFSAFSGHALQLPLAGDVTAQVSVSADLAAQYDQLGLLLSADAAHWVKLSLERIGGRLRIVCVATDGRSDASLCPYPGTDAQATLRLSLRGDSVVAEWQLPGADGFEVIRLAPRPGPGPFRLGPMACAPKGPGFKAQFADFVIGPAPDEEVDA